MKNPKVNFFGVLMLFGALVIPLISVSADSNSSPWITIYSTQAGNPGSQLQVYGYSFAPNSAISIGLGTAGSQLVAAGSATADGKGSFQTNVAIPSTAKVGDRWTVGAIASQNGAASSPITLDFVIGQVPANQQSNPAPTGGYNNNYNGGYSGNGGYSYNSNGMYNYGGYSNSYNGAYGYGMNRGYAMPGMYGYGMNRGYAMPGMYGYGGYVNRFPMYNFRPPLYSNPFRMRVFRYMPPFRGNMMGRGY